MPEYSRTYAQLVFDGGDDFFIPLPMGEPNSEQLQGNARENTLELCGRVCYDSLGSGRPTKEYHDNLISSKHLSVYEHTPVTVEFDMKKAGVEPIDMCCLMNRPGVTLLFQSQTIVRITFNYRAAMEWVQNTTNNTLVDEEIRDAVNFGFQQTAPMVYEIARKHYPIPEINGGVIEYAKIVEPKYPQEQHVTIFMSGSRGFCYDSETEVLTEDGWKTWPEVNGSERFATLNMETEELEYQEASAVIHDPYHGEMVKVSSQFVDMLVTPNHRMVVRKHDTQAAKRGEEPLSIINAGNLNKRVKLKRTAKWVGENPLFYIIPDVSIESDVVNQTGNCGTRTIVCAGRKVKALPFARMIGWWLAEGSLDHSHRSGYSTVISQSMKSKYWDDILTCIEDAGFTYSINRSASCPQIRINGGRALYDYLEPFRGSESKAIPTDLKQWGPEYQRALIEGYLAGDGSNSGGRHAGEGHTVSKHLADDLQEAALKAGISASIRVVDRRNEDAPIKHRKLIYVVGFAQHKGQEPLVNHNGKNSVSREHYSGMVHCVTVPNGTLYVRRNGKPCWSGNSHEQVRHRFSISQRSTRYVDESKSPWVRHPLILQYLKNVQGAGEIEQVLDQTVESSQLAYKTLVKQLEGWLTEQGHAKTPARKQARGAARGFLGNALQTEMMFTASVKAWRDIMLVQRASKFADAEIREVYAGAPDNASHVIAALKQSRFADHFSDVKVVASPDGIGNVME